MKKITLLSIFSLMLGSSAIAQKVEPCGFDHIHQNLLKNDPVYAKGVKEMDYKLSLMSKLRAKARFVPTADGGVYEIPMVLHIIHNSGDAVGSSYNPSMSSIESMVEHLNKSFAAETPFVEDGAGGTKFPIKFVLAKRAPDGTATTGVIRHAINSTTYPSYSSDGINMIATTGLSSEEIAGLSRWHPADYYNVYVVNKIDGRDGITGSGSFTAGFAYLPFPGFSSQRVDGMYVLASQIATLSTTVSHEFGHGFALYHTFEGEGGGTAPSCPIETDCATQNDMVCDTEPHYKSAYFPSWCPPTDVNPCTGGSYKNVQNNIMDYTSCGMYRYTPGQRERFMDVLDNFRVGFKYSRGGEAPSGTVKTAVCNPTNSSGVAGFFGVERFEFDGQAIYTGGLWMEQTFHVDHSYTQQFKTYPGATVDIVVSTNYNAQKVAVFIDYNNDGDFGDAGEVVMTKTGSTAGAVDHTQTITIPTSATTCAWLRMRVAAVSAFSSITDLACGNYSNNGQVEDYAIYINPSAPVSDPVNITQTKGTNPSCVGEELKFKASVKAGLVTGSSMGYTWKINGVNTTIVSDEFNSTLFGLNDGDILSCMVSYYNACGDLDSAFSNEVKLEINASLDAVATLSVIDGAIPGCAGADVTFKADVLRGGSSPVFDWRINGVSTSAPSFDTFTTNALNSGDIIYCIVTPNSSCASDPVNSDTITFTVGAVTPEVNIGLVDGSIPSCDSSKLILGADPILGGTLPKYQWFINGLEVIGETNSTFEDSFIIKNNDKVTCRMISNHICVDPGVNDTVWSSELVINRNPNVVPTFSVDVNRGANPGCLDSLLEYKVSGVGLGDNPQIIWYLNGSVVANGDTYGSTSFANGDVITCDIIPEASACSKIDTLKWGPEKLDLSTTPESPLISLIGNMLVSSVTTNIQWYGPAGLIVGATSGTYHPTEYGDYYAVAMNGGCSSPKSNVLNVALLHILSNKQGSVKVYPNPSLNGIVHVEFSNTNDYEIEVYNLLGQKINTNKVTDGNKVSINMANYANGNYFIIIKDGESKLATIPVNLNQ
jgi:hypothetical protein